MRLMLQFRGQQIFSVMGKIVNIFDFVTHMVSAETTQFCLQKLS